MCAFSYFAKRDLFQEKSCPNILHEWNQMQRFT